MAFNCWLKTGPIIAALRVIRSLPSLCENSEFPALKARNVIAQGNALGKNP
jgi:hypothetical protein